MQRHQSPLASRRRRACKSPWKRYTPSVATPISLTITNTAKLSSRPRNISGRIIVFIYTGFEISDNLLKTYTYKSITNTKGYLKQMTIHHKSLFKVQQRYSRFMIIRLRIIWSSNRGYNTSQFIKELKMILIGHWLYYGRNINTISSAVASDIESEPQREMDRIWYTFISFWTGVVKILI